MKKRRSTPIYVFFLAVAVILLVITFIYYPQNNANNLAFETRDKHLKNLPLAMVATKEMSGSYENCPTNLFFFRVLGADGEASVYTDYFAYPQAWASTILSLCKLHNVTPRNFVVVNDSVYFSLTAGNVIPDYLSRQYYQDRINDNIVNMRGVAQNMTVKARPVNWNRIDSLVIAGYLLEAGKLKFYQIVGKANNLGKILNPFYDTDSGAEVENKFITWGIKVPANLSDSILRLSGSGVYLWKNGQMTNELVGILNNVKNVELSFIDQSESDSKIHQSDSVVFASFNTLK